MVGTRKLIYAALLTALSIVASRLLSFMIPIGGVGAVRLGYGPVPVMLSGLMLGPWWGAAVGAVSDALGYVINPMGGAYLPQITVVSALSGLLPALFIQAMHHARLQRPHSHGNVPDGPEAGFGSILLAVTFTQILLSLILMPVILYQAFGIPIVVNVPLRLLTQAILVPTYAIAIFAVYRAWGRYNAAVAGASAGGR